MKRNIIFFCSLLVLFIFLTSAPIWAQVPDLNMWVNKWFKIIEKNNGYYYDGTKMIKEVDLTTTYMLITNWDADEQTLSAERYHDDEGPFETLFYYAGGGNMDFFVKWESYSEPYYNGIVARITGKMNGMSIKSAKFKTLGGAYVGQNEDPETPYPDAGGFSWNGKLIEEDKLPLNIKLSTKPQ